MIEDTIKQSTNISEQNNFLDKPKDRNLTLDILRIIACFLVIVCHTNPWGFVMSNFNLPWFVSIGIYLISKTAVPIFFMISGFLNLRNDYTYKEILKKTITRLVIPLTIFSIIVYAIDNSSISFYNIGKFFMFFLQENISISYWFLYELIGLYLVTPLIKKMIKNFEEKDYKYLIIIWIFSQCIMPIIGKILKININNRIPIVTGYVGYYILGYYIFSKPINKNIKYLFLNILSFIATILISVLITYFDRSNSVDKQYIIYMGNLNWISIIIPTVNIVYIIRYIFDNIKFNKKIQKFIITVSSTTFGIYLIHFMLLNIFKQLTDIISLYMPKLVATTLIQIIIFVTLVIFIYLIRKIPIIKKIL